MFKNNIIYVTWHQILNSYSLSWHLIWLNLVGFDPVLSYCLNCNQSFDFILSPTDCFFGIHNFPKNLESPVVMLCEGHILTVLILVMRVIGFTF